MLIFVVCWCIMLEMQYTRRYHIMKENQNNTNQQGTHKSNVDGGTQTSEQNSNQNNGQTYSRVPSTSGEPRPDKNNK